MCNDREFDALKRKVMKFEYEMNKNLEKRNNADYSIVGEKVNNHLNMLRFKQRRILSGHFEKIYATKWMNKNPHIISISNDSNMIKWDAQLGNKLAATTLKTPWNLTLAISPNDDTVVIGGLDNVCTLYSIPKTTEEVFEYKGEFAGHTGYISRVDYLCNNMFISASGDNTARLWDVTQEKETQVYKAHIGEVLGVSRITENLFATCSADTTVLVWDIRTGSCIHWFANHAKDVNEVQMHPNGFGLVTASNDCTCKLLDLRYNGELAVFHAMEQILPISCIALSKNGRLLFSAGEDQYCTVWDVADTKPINFFQAHDNTISSINVSPDGYALSTASWDKMIGIWTLK